MSHQTTAQIEKANISYAGKRRRLLNLLIDLVMVQILAGTLVNYCALFLIKTFNPSMSLRLTASDNIDFFNNELIIYSWLIASFTMLVYYVVGEYFFNGRTIGKLFTKTKAVSANGTRVKFKEALLRSAIRIIPLEPLSGFDTMTWHDRWSGTKVISLQTGINGR